MTAPPPQDVFIEVGDGERVSGLLMSPRGARACYVLAHGAGAGMRHAFMGAVAAGLFGRGIATLRYQFLYMEKGTRRVDTPTVAHAAVRGAAAEAARLLPGLALFAGGKSFGGRMTSQAQAAAAMPGVRGLVFIGFPLHPAGKPAATRAEHLSKVEIPMLFLQGTRDELADLALIRGVAARLGARATLRELAEADHMFHVPARTGRKDADVLEEVVGAIAGWVQGVLGSDGDVSDQD